MNENKKNNEKPSYFDIVESDFAYHDETNYDIILYDCNDNILSYVPFSHYQLYELNKYTNELIQQGILLRKDARS